MARFFEPRCRRNSSCCARRSLPGRLPRDARVVHLAAVRQDREVGQTQIDPDFPVRRGERLVVDLHHERGVIPAGGVQRDRHRRRLAGQAPRPAHRHVADPGQPQPPGGVDPEPGSPGEPDRLRPIPPRPEPRRPQPAALACAPHRGEEVPVSGVRIRQRLLQHDRGHLGQPHPLRGPFRRGQRLRQRRITRVRLALLVCGAAGCDRVVEHHPRTAERPRQRDPLPRGRVEAVGVPELHTSTVRSRTDKNGRAPAGTARSCSTRT